MKFIDMHTHSTASDGVYRPKELVEYALEKGLSGIAITDHDTIDGIEEAVDHASIYKDFIVIPGIELSAEYHGEEVHILGYGIDYKNSSLKEKLRYLEKERRDRAYKIVSKLNSMGMKLDYESIMQTVQNGVVGRPHIARALVEHGYVKNLEEAFNKYLAQDAAAYVPRAKLSPQEAIGLIKAARGISVLAHPGLIQSDKIIEDILTLGIDGIEVYHSEHTGSLSRKFLEMAEEHNLFVTAGSDFHFPPDNDESYHGDLGSIKISLDSIQKLFRRA
ncbi:PHP domain-containing protein [Alkaliphilus oremlandii]|uniref:PHP domain protein n=1 Tax=Alkaliphilus oremlandii (strain OhILAs) TaxID=350688 RepID=A8MFC5_ALKOO|nr:PHP domain-containing protein [Alkaliphilus oremlandii]ABW19088.1 PHP domain protein [Alkaliphilus oremlandii OhILAs]